jgi:hypothetical protein
MSKKYLLNLQRFAEGAPASEGSGEGTDDAGQSTSQVNPDELFGTGEEDEELEDNPDDNPDDNEAEESFDDLIKGRYKKDFNARVSGIVKDRVKNYQENLDRQNNLLSFIAEKYGVESTDIDALEKAIMEDDSYYEAEAIERGIDVKTLKHIKKLEHDNEKFAENIREREKQQQNNEAWAEVLEQAEEVKKLYPDFDIETEMKNETFGLLVAANVPLRTAFEAVHMDELQPQVMKFVADKTAKKVAESVKNNRKRPQEGSGGSQGLRVKKDMSRLSDAERDEINRRVLNGEKIYW